MSSSVEEVELGKKPAPPPCVLDRPDAELGVPDSDMERVASELRQGTDSKVAQ